MLSKKGIWNENSYRSNLNMFKYLMKYETTQSYLRQTPQWFGIKNVEIGFHKNY